MSDGQPGTITCREKKKGRKMCVENGTFVGKASFVRKAKSDVAYPIDRSKQALFNEFIADEENASFVLRVRKAPKPHCKSDWILEAIDEEEGEEDDGCIESFTDHSQCD